MATQALLFSSSLMHPAPAAMDGSVPAVIPDGNGGGMPVAIPIADPGVDLASKTVCIKVRVSTMGNTRKVSTSQIEADADKDLLRVSKHLVDSAADHSGGVAASYQEVSCAYLPKRLRPELLGDGLPPGNVYGVYLQVERGAEY